MRIDVLDKPDGKSLDINACSTLSAQPSISNNNACLSATSRQNRKIERLAVSFPHLDAGLLT